MTMFWMKPTVNSKTMIMLFIVAMTVSDNDDVEEEIEEEEEIKDNNRSIDYDTVIDDNNDADDDNDTAWCNKEI